MQIKETDRAYNNVLTSIADVDFSKMADLTEINFMKNYVQEIKDGTLCKEQPPAKSVESA